MSEFTGFCYVMLGIITMIILFYITFNIITKFKENKRSKNKNNKKMIENLTVETFKEKVFDYTTGGEWEFKGTKPAIIDFFSSWCQPCKTIAPILEELDAEHPDVDIYKINTEEQSELAATFGIQSIPSILFIPVGGEPQLAVGALPKESFKQAIGEIFNPPSDGIEDVEEIKE